MTQSNAVVRQTGPKDVGNILFEDARIIFRNFSGLEGQYNREGDRNFCLILSPEDAAQMAADGWNVKHLRAREEGDEPTPYIQVAVSYKKRPPKIRIITQRGQTDLPEDMVSVLDWAEIANVDLIINPYPWSVGGKSGIKAYVKTLYVTIAEDELERKYADVPDSAQNVTIPDQLAIGTGEDNEDIYVEFTELEE